MSDAPSTDPRDGTGAATPVVDPGDPRLDVFRRLNDPAARRRIDDDESVFVVEGKLAVARLLVSDYSIRSLLVDRHQADASADLVTEARSHGASVLVGSRALVEETVGFDLHRGVVAVAHRPIPADPARVMAEAGRTVGPGGDPPVVLVLEGLNDHENIGVLFRNAAAFGVVVVLLDPTCADPLYRRSVRVSMGHVLQIPFARLTPWPAALACLRDAGFTVAALVPRRVPGLGAPQATLSGLRERRIGGRSGVAFLVGAEGSGLSPSALSAADETVTIPMAGGVDSLNVATAAAVALYGLTYP